MTLPKRPNHNPVVDSTGLDSDFTFTITSVNAIATSSDSYQYIQAQTQAIHKTPVENAV